MFISKSRYDVTEDEIQDYVSLPEWSKNSTIIPNRDKNMVNYVYIDFSHSNAYDVIVRPFRTLVNIAKQIEIRTPFNLVLFWYKVLKKLDNDAPFISESIWTEACIRLYRLEKVEVVEGRINYGMIKDLCRK